MYDQAYVDYLAHFHGTRDYFECHELLEDRWKEETPLDRQAVWVGLIQLAVAMYHYRRNNYKGASRTAQKARTILQNKKEHLQNYGLDQHKMIGFLDDLMYKLELKKPYESMNLPIIDQKLLYAVQQRCNDLGCIYGAPSPLEDTDLIHRHSRRDRSEVIEERKRQLQKRQEDRS
ncbi:DUF309 domain-containing protein [Pontibacillus yanchengensis]|uniref:DUF309 domain-containing protein n=2 Tax=Pontibacillus yanchengensis TaxID=462910 RepID=A0ACC7VHY9_9BACI|nr:DUF309 domain-containing protein [Pontibacillus yanchengensis]MYL32684.1 DUF309 domain-containing protein [Pontibacillus yanchengensis]MYL55078.1 DUF309 domain-containing protein [Pontibacillus yanchengensis]